MSDQKDQSSSNSDTNLPGPRTQFPNLFPSESSTQSQSSAQGTVPAEDSNKRTFQSMPEGLIPVEDSTRVIRTSDPSRPFGCSKCEKRFVRNIDLETSVNFPNGSDFEAFVCCVPGCGSRFKTKSNLNRHERTHGESSTSTE
ncbi:hypothetical protein M422DRAFT_45338 [Sphaerobolus stellatus SS14]|nr:hypothetical protein M422DRAFT_45338 [Sphaerobolus stellatus SS14]